MTHTPRKQAKPMTSVGKDIFDTILYTFGIYFCYILYGVMQEEIYRVGSGDDKFKYSLFLVFVQCAVNCILAAIVLIATGQATNNGTPALEFFQPSCAYIGAMFSSNLSLVYVSYPTQALGKSCKLIPVMLMSVLVHGKRYKLREYINVLLITVGISVFQLMKASKKSGGGEDSPIGLFLLFTSLVLDGFVGPSQEKLIEKRQPSQTQLMFQMNMYACLLLTVALVATNGMLPAIAFCQRFPEVWKFMIAFSVLSALGQTVIMMTLFRFNSLILTTITTTRKFFTILASVVIFGHTLTVYQWLGVGLVFLGLGLDIYHKYHDKKQRHKAHLDALAKDGDAKSPRKDAKSPRKDATKSPRKEAPATTKANEQELRKRK